MLSSLSFGDYAIIITCAVIAFFYFFTRLPLPEAPPKTAADVVQPVLFNPAHQPDPATLKEMTRAEVRYGDGLQGRPVYISIANKVFDCTAGARFYGPGGAYEAFAGRDITRAAAKFSTEDRYLDCPSLQGLTLAELDSMKHFYNVFMGKYPMIAKLKQEENVGGVQVSEDASRVATVQSSNDSGANTPNTTNNAAATTAATATVSDKKDAKSVVANADVKVIAAEKAEDKKDSGDKAGAAAADVVDADAKETEAVAAVADTLADSKDNSKTADDDDGSKSNSAADE